MGAITGISGFIRDLDFDDLPPDVVEAAKLPFADCIGVTVAGLDDPASKTVAAWVEEMAAAPVSTLLLGFNRTAPVLAALANGTAAHALDFDDVNFRMMGHPSVALVPAILAAGEAIGSSGRECILSYVIGLEVAAKVGQAMGGNPYVIGWHQTSTLGTLGAAASCGKLLGLDETGLANALGISCSLASGLRANFGTMTKPFHAGMAAMNGLMAAQLASRGFDSSPESMFGENGMSRAFSADLDKEDTVAGSLGNPHELVDPGLSYKPYPCCRGPQGAIDAAIMVHDELAGASGEVDIARISEVRCRVPEWLRGVLTYHRPKTGLEGKFSLEFCVTAGVIDGRVNVGQFTDERVNANDVVLTIDKVEWKDFEGEVTSPFAAEVTVTLSDGTGITKRVERPLGEPGNPMSEEQIFDKYLECVGNSLGFGIAGRSLEMLKQLERLDTVGSLLESLDPRSVA